MLPSPSGTAVALPRTDSLTASSAVAASGVLAPAVQRAPSTTGLLPAPSPAHAKYASSPRNATSLPAAFSVLAMHCSCVGTPPEIRTAPAHTPCFSKPTYAVPEGETPAPNGKLDRPL